MDQALASVRTVGVETALAWLDHASDLVIHLDRDWRIVHANRRFTERAGIPLEDLRGKDAFATFAHRGILFEDKARTAMATRRPTSGRAYHPELGKWIEARFVPLADGLAVYTRDVTDARNLEEDVLALSRQQASVARLGQFALAGPPLQAVLQQAAGEVASVLDGDLAALAECLPGTNDLLIRAGAGWDLGTVGHALLRGGRDAPAGLALETGEPIVVNDLANDPRFVASPIVTRHGVFAGIAVPITAAGNPWGVACVMWRTPRRALAGDVHYLQSLAHLVAAAIERDRREEDLRRHRDELEALVAERTRQLSESLRELESFSYSVSHDLRTSLRTVGGFSDLLALRHGKSLPAEAQTLVQRIRGGAVQMAALVEDLLALSRVGQTELRLEPVDVTALARACLARLAGRVPPGHLTYSVADGLHAIAHPGLVATLLENLLDNAVKFSSGAERPHVEVGQRPDGAFYVRDNGVGFPMEFVGKLFQPFSRLHGSLVPGTGIGLATVARIVRRHGGDVGAESEPGQGACFWFTLPARASGALA